MTCHLLPNPLCLGRGWVARFYFIQRLVQATDAGTLTLAYATDCVKRRWKVGMSSLARLGRSRLHFDSRCFAEELD